MRKYIAECVGTMLLTLIACGIAVTSNVDLVATSLAFGLVIVAAAYSIGNVSGCHINPAVSIALTVAGKMDVKECIRYIIAQIIGAFVGSLLLALCLRGKFDALGANTIQDYLKTGGKLDAWSYISAFLVEVVLTMIFVFAIIGVTDSKFGNGKLGGIVIGATLVLVHLLGLKLTGTSVNPARSLAPAALNATAGRTESIQQIWIWVCAPLAGGALAAVLYGVLFPKKEQNLEETKEAQE